jgi:hypothetical protein
MRYMQLPVLVVTKPVYYSRLFFSYRMIQAHGLVTSTKQNKRQNCPVNTSAGKKDKLKNIRPDGKQNKTGENDLYFDTQRNLNTHSNVPMFYNR